MKMLVTKVAKFGNILFSCFNCAKYQKIFLAVIFYSQHQHRLVLPRGWETPQFHREEERRGEGERERGREGV